MHRLSPLLCTSINGTDRNERFLPHDCHLSTTKNSMLMNGGSFPWVSIPHCALDRLSYLGVCVCVLVLIECNYLPRNSCAPLSAATRLAGDVQTLTLLTTFYRECLTNVFLMSLPPSHCQGASLVLLYLLLLFPLSGFSFGSQTTTID